MKPQKLDIYAKAKEFSSNSRERFAFMQGAEYGSGMIVTPLLVTEDGVPYYDDNDLVWDTHDYEGNSKAIYSNPNFLEQTEVKYAKNIPRKFFSTKEAAENYRKCYFKCLSYNDVWNMNDNKSSDNNFIAISKQELTKTVNDKINKL